MTKTRKGNPKPRRRQSAAEVRFKRTSASLSKLLRDGLTLREVAAVASIATHATVWRLSQGKGVAVMDYLRIETALRRLADKLRRRNAAGRSR